ncbi:[protein-PII] uridylyltransferase [Fundidesulfovibrio soli]|uniref:[protein-PII] uridylyltransferase n=1 Tax=Fundidesulfovibrio soli TaxID=2922716 RepID=UPI001FAEB191|nr:[protein-PII] uridylyltransferase [Fundidesulfovibrio soli]
MAISTPSAFDTLKRDRQDILAQPDATLSRRLSEAFDAYFRARVGEVPPQRTPYAVMAVGGYGRSELCPRSDIDVLILYKKSVPGEAKELSQGVFFPLWDLGLELGHGVRSISDCIDLSRKDWQVFASLLDVRLLAGDAGVFEEFVARRDKKLLPGAGRNFKLWLERQNASRSSTYGDASGMLEPNLKEGMGGLRDVHQVRWLDFLSRREGEGLPQDDLDVLNAHMRFLLTVRNHLHLLESHKTDRLGLDAQRELAGRLGFEASGEILAVEAFMAELHRVMAEIRTLHRASWPLLAMEPGRKRAAQVSLGGCAVLGQEGLGFDLPPGRHVSPEQIVELFGYALRHGKAMSLAARRAIEAGLPDLASFAATAEGAAHARDLLTRAMLHPGSEAALTDMVETGVLGALLPEFARVRDMVQYDVFHIHPVGRHTLETIFEIKRLADPDSPYHAHYAALPHPERLYWGALCHDIGKGLGGAHSEKGADIVRELLDRLGMGDEALSDVCFLVLRHLMLADTAFRRDISDRDILAECAQRTGTVQRLDMLLLLTVADSRATGPSAWNDWKASLLGELYGKVRAVLTGGKLFDPSDAQHMMVLRDHLHDKARGLFNSERLEACLDAMPPRYLLSRKPENILGDLALVSQLEADLEEDFRQRPSSVAGRGVAAVETIPYPGGDGWKVTLAARHQPSLFATVAGVLALHDVNIRSAEFFLWSDSTELHAYQTSNPPDTLYPDELWARVRRAVRYALTGKLSLDYRIQQKRASPLTPRQPDMGITPGVVVDNEGSDYFTIIQVRAGDRIGLLYDIAVVLDSLGLDVRMAKIDTQGLDVFDVFFVRGEKGRKVTEGSRLEEIRLALLAAVA